MNNTELTAITEDSGVYIAKNKIGHHVYCEIHNWIGTVVLRDDAQIIANRHKKRYSQDECWKGSVINLMKLKHADEMEEANYEAELSMRGMDRFGSLNG